MSWSFSEIRFLAVKAAKGAGLPWGLAEEAGFATQWLEENNLPGVDALAGYLEACEAQTSIKADQCPIAQGTWISDTAVFSPPLKLILHQPLLFAPFLMAVIGDNEVEMAWNDCTVKLGKGCVGVDAGEILCSSPTALSVNTCASQEIPICQSSRIPDARQASVKILERFASKTYAPATEASRLAGAGAGTTDND